MTLSMEGIDKRQRGEKMENSTSNEVVVDGGKLGVCSVDCSKSKCALPSTLNQF